MQWTQILELVGASCSIIYSLLLMREKTVGWWFGIASSFIGIWLFFYAQLYAQSAISLYFMGVGFYGLWYWKKAEKEHEHIHIWTINTHVVYILIFIVLALISTLFFNYFTDSSSPMFDSFITLFGLLASIKEARKILSSWVYWFVINLASVVLYYQQNLYYYACLMVLYAIICIPGYFNWLAIYRKHLS
jgi:nicotinamide mononucleotide transporter